MARIKLLRNKRDIQIKQLRKEIAQLLTSGQEPSARIRVEHVYREENILAAYDILELFCELITVRLPIIESQKYVGHPPYSIPYLRCHLLCFPLKFSDV
jgi:hypothetical protein